MSGKGTFQSYILHGLDLRHVVDSKRGGRHGDGIGLTTVALTDLYNTCSGAILDDDRAPTKRYWMLAARVELGRLIASSLVDQFGDSQVTAVWKIGILRGKTVKQAEL